MIYASMDEMYRNVSNQIFRSKEDKAVFVTALDNVTDRIRITELAGKKKNLDCTLQDIYTVYPPVGMMNTKDKSLVCISKPPRRQYQVGISSTNTLCKQINGPDLDPIEVIKKSPHWYERSIIKGVYPSLSKALEMMEDGYTDVALSRVLAIRKDIEYGRLLIFNRMSNVIASKSIGVNSKWMAHSDAGLPSILGELNA